MSNKFKILFLDIDSVLNCFKFGETEFRDEYSLVQENVPLMAEKVSLLKRILDRDENLRVVWTTDWRFRDEEICGKWKNPRLWLESQEWFKQKLIGKTLMKFSSTRPEEIRMWLRYPEDISRRHVEVENYAILDDYDSQMMRDFGDHLFLTSWEEGLTQEIATGVIQFLKRKKKVNRQDEM